MDGHPNDEAGDLPPPPASAVGRAERLVRDWWPLVATVVVLTVAVVGFEAWQRISEPSPAAKQACGSVEASGFLFNLVGQDGREVIAPMLYGNALVGLEADESEIRAAARRVQAAGETGSGTSLKIALENFLQTCEDLGIGS